MFFRKKLRNKRLGREHVLDVKLRSSQVRATRARMTIVALSIVFATVFGIYVAWRAGQYALDQMVYQNTAFALKEIDVETDGVIAVDQLRRWAGVKLGDNLLALDLGTVKRNLELIPLVRFASIERVVPHTLRIRVQEREPVAQVNIPRPKPGGGLEIAVFHLDADGWVMTPLEPRQRSVPFGAPSPYPVISGVAGNQLQTGRRVDSSQILAALNLITAFEQSPMVGMTDLLKVDVSSPGVISVSTSHGSEVVFALANLEQQLCRWREVFDAGRRAGKAIAFLDLAVNNNIPVRWLEATAVPAVSKPAKPTKIRRKHV